MKLCPPGGRILTECLGDRKAQSSPTSGMDGNRRQTTTTALNSAAKPTTRRPYGAYAGEPSGQGVKTGGGSGAGNQLSPRDEAKRWVGLREARILGVSAGLRRSPPGKDWASSSPRGGCHRDVAESLAEARDRLFSVLPQPVKRRLATSGRRRLSKLNEWLQALSG